MDLERIKVILGLDLEDTSEDTLLTILLENAISTICVYLNVGTFPASLEFIAQELAVARYRKIGAEGISTEKIDDISTTYSVNDLNRYKDVLETYKNNNDLCGKKLRTLWYTETKLILLPRRR